MLLGQLVLRMVNMSLEGVMVVEKGIARMKSTMSLAGSTSPLNRCLANLRAHFQISHPRLAKMEALSRSAYKDGTSNW